MLQLTKLILCVFSVSAPQRLVKILSLLTAGKALMDTSDIRDLAPGTAAHGKPKKEFRDILKVATEILAYEGYSKFHYAAYCRPCWHYPSKRPVLLQDQDILFQSVIEQRLKHDIESATKVIEES